MASRVIHKSIIRRPARSDLVVAGDEIRAMLDLPPAAEQNAAELEAKVWAATNPDAPPMELPEYPVAVKTWKEISPFLAQYLESVEGMIRDVRICET